MLITLEHKKELRNHFNIKNITQARLREGFSNTDDYYTHLERIFNPIIIPIIHTILLPNQLTKSMKKRLKRKRSIENQLKTKCDVIEDCDSSVEDVVIESEPLIPIKLTIERPHICFKEYIPYNEKKVIINMLNNLWSDSIYYCDFILENSYSRIKIVKGIHLDMSNDSSYHFNVCFISANKMSRVFHMYLKDDVIVGMSQLLYLNL